MADEVVKLSVKVNAETGQLEILGAKLQEVGKKAEGTEDSFGNLTKGAKDLALAFLPFATATGAVAFFASAVQGAEEENEALRKLSFTLKQFGADTKDSEQAVKDWAGAIQAATRFSDSEALSSLERLVRVTGNLTQAQMASQLSMGLSVQSGKSLQETESLIIELLNGNQRALMQVNKEFGAFTGGAKTAQQALDALNNAFSKAAFEDKSFTSDVSRLKNALNDMKEQVGAGLIPFLADLAQKTNSLLPAFQKVAAVVSGIAGAAMKLFIMDLAGARDAVQTMNLQLEGLSRQQEVNALKTQETGRIIAQQSRQQLADREEQARKLAVIEVELDQKIAAIGEETFSKKRAMMAAELAAQRVKINNELKNESDKAKAMAKLHDLELKEQQRLAKEEFQIKTATALQVVDLSLQTLQILNDMGDNHSKGEVRRAKAILALEKAIAIARVFAAEASKGVAGIAIAAASTALITAQFFQQSKAIEQAAAAANQGREEFKISVPLPGSSGNLDQTFGGQGPTFTGGGGGGGGGAAPAGAGGGGIGTVIQNINVSVNLTADNLDLSDRRAVLRALAEEMRGMASVEAIQFALAAQNLATKNASLAV
jgi:hypothetical protein